MASYGHLKVEDLKKLLRERGACLKGKKKDLVERLELYDEHNNFCSITKSGYTETTESDNLKRLFTPLTENLRDINASTALPPITMAHIEHFLDRFEVTVERGKKMYQNQFLLNARMAKENSLCYFTGQCKASMKKAIVYNMTVHVSSYGSIEGCQCDCCVGEPPNAHCKHVIALLLAIEEMKREKKNILNVSCTQQLQSFHRPLKNYFGSPLKADKLHTGKRESFGNINVFPINPTKLNNEKYREKIRNMTVNYVSHFHSTMPFKHTIFPANIYGVVKDHNYAADVEKETLKTLHHCDVTDSHIQDIETLTRNQANDKKWHEIRRNHITASNFHPCCKTISVQAKDNLVERMLNPVEFKSKQTQHGKDCELRAIQCFETQTEINVQKCGLFLYKNKPYLGASPDGLIGQETILEVKCPYNQRYYSISDTTIPYLWKNAYGSLYLEEAHPYYYQIQGQLMATGRKYANLLIYTFVDWTVIDVPRNDGFIKAMEEKLDLFYLEYFRPALLEKVLYKNYAKCFYKEC